MTYILLGGFEKNPNVSSRHVCKVSFFVNVNSYISISSNYFDLNPEIVPHRRVNKIKLFEKNVYIFKFTELVKTCDELVRIQI